MKKAIFFLSVTVICWVISIALCVRFAAKISEKSNQGLAVLEAPGSVIFPIEEVENIALWHNYRDLYGGKTVNHASELPSGFGFELKEMSSGALIPLNPAFANSTYTVGQVSKRELGVFEVMAPGDYELTVTAPPGESRVFSLGPDTFVEDFGSFFFLLAGAGALAFIGLITLILSIVMFFTKSKSKPPVPAPPTYAA